MIKKFFNLRSALAILVLGLVVNTSFLIFSYLVGNQNIADVGLNVFLTMVMIAIFSLLSDALNYREKTT